MKPNRWLPAFAFILSVSSLFVQHAGSRGAVFPQIATALYGTLAALFILDLILGAAHTASRFHYFRKNSISLLLTLIFTLFFFIHLGLEKSGAVRFIGESLPFLALLRSFFILVDLSGDLRQFNYFVQGLFAHPSRTILMSFLSVILIGAVLLQLPIATADGKGLTIIDALFTSTSAVCVTGLIVVDTATAFSLFGKLVILVLIQIGGLSIIILSSFVVFILRKQVSLEGKFLVSFVLNQNDVNSLSSSLKRIVIITFLFEGLGAVLLFGRFQGQFGFFGEAALQSVFHAVSAFCNAGFSLFTTSLETYVRDPYVTSIVALLIICGGLSFAVFSNLFEVIRDKYRARRRDRRQFVKKLTLNTKVVLGVSALLIVTGLFLVYALEHGNSLKGYGTGTQYLAAFFQSVTLRTAGFNTIPFAGLTTATLLVMMVYMFIGGASGSTAGGIKVNTFTIISLYLKATVKNEPSITLFKHSISREYVMRGVLIFFFGTFAVFFGTFILSITEDAPLVNVMFEVVSAFGTVGLSTGITGALTIVGKVVIIVLMFIGRTGPLTILAALGEKSRKVHYEYPYGDILIG